MNALLSLLINLIIIFGMVVAVGLSYIAIWTFLFFPVMKLNKFNEAKANFNREYNKIEVEHAKLLGLTEQQKEKYDKVVLLKQKVIDEKYKVEEDLKQKQKLKKEHELEFALFNKWRDTAAGKRAMKELKKS